MNARPLVPLHAFSTNCVGEISRSANSHGPCHALKKGFRVLCVSIRWFKTSEQEARQAASTGQIWSKFTEGVPCFPDHVVQRVSTPLAKAKKHWHSHFQSQPDWAPLLGWRRARGNPPRSPSLTASTKWRPSTWRLFDCAESHHTGYETIHESVSRRPVPGWSVVDAGQRPESGWLTLAAGLAWSNSWTSPGASPEIASAPSCSQMSSIGWREISGSPVGPMSARSICRWLQSPQRCAHVHQAKLSYTKSPCSQIL